MSVITRSDIENAHSRIKDYTHTTPIFQSNLLNKWLGHELYFKGECFQKTGSFKLRGALNMMLKAKQEGRLPSKVIASSSGNHAQAVAYAAHMLGVKATIYSAQNISKVKAAATQYYGATLDLSSTRKQADAKVKQASQQHDVLWIPPFNHEDIIAGQGTVLMEAMQQVDALDAVFAPLGGGGLISGSHIYGKSVNSSISINAAEPLVANDAAQSRRFNTIQMLSAQPVTLADGAATLSVGEKTFEYIKLLDNVYEIEETDIAYWTQWLQHLLKIHVEPTSAMSMAGVCQWLQHKTTTQRVLVVLSGGNIDYKKMHQVWNHDYLDTLPSL